METMCNGKGECLLQDDYYGYYKNPDMICNYNCVPINCKNYELCGKSFPEQYQKGEGTCLNCDIIFGKWNGGKGILQLSDIEECCVCLENKIHISLPKCNHKLCIECMRKIYFNEEDEEDDEGNIIKEGNVALGNCPLCRT